MPRPSREAGLARASKLFDEALTPFGVQSSQLPVLAAAALFGEAAAAMGQLAQALLISSPAAAMTDETLHPIDRRPTDLNVMTSRGCRVLFVPSLRRVLHLAIAERPILAACVDQIDPDVFPSHTSLRMNLVSDLMEESLFHLRRSSADPSDLDDDEIARVLQT
jgi:hypothetical protein